MRLFLLLVLIFSVWVENSGAAELQGRLVREKSETENLKLGDTFSARLEVWPIKEFPSFPVDKLEIYIKNKKLLGLFYVAAVESIKISENNQDVVTVDLTISAVSPFKQTELYLLEVESYKIPITLENIGPIAAEKLEVTDFIFEDEKLINLINWKMAALILILVVATVGFVYPSLRRRQQKKKETKQRKIKREEAYHYWKRKLEGLNGRSDIEFFWVNRKYWSALFDIEESTLKSIEQFIEEEMYRPEWPNEKIKNALEMFSKIKNAQFKEEVTL